MAEYTDLPNQPIELLGKFTPRSFVRIGTILFMVSITLAYSLYPHWLTLSHFVEHWYTLIPFALAMLITVFELWYLGGRIRQHVHLSAGANALRASAVCAALIICIPYAGGPIYESAHNIVALLFVLFAAFGFASFARRLRNYALGAISGALVGICMLELIFLAHYNAHPVYPWVWVVLELAAIALLVTALYIIAIVLERKITLS